MQVRQFARQIKVPSPSTHTAPPSAVGTHTGAAGGGSSHSPSWSSAAPAANRSQSLP